MFPAFFSLMMWSEHAPLRQVSPASLSDDLFPQSLWLAWLASFPLRTFSQILSLREAPGIPLGRRVRSSGSRLLQPLPHPPPTPLVMCIFGIPPWRSLQSSPSLTEVPGIPLWRSIQSSPPLTEVPSIPLWRKFPASPSLKSFSQHSALAVCFQCAPLSVFPASLFRSLAFLLSLSLSTVISVLWFSYASLSRTESTHFFCYVDGLSNVWRQLWCLPGFHVLET